jgi:adenylate cyclase
MKSHILKLFGLGILILSALVILRVKDPYPIEVIRLKGLDYYQRSQDKVKSDNVVIIEIDEKSLDEKGQWPWPRNELAEGIKKAFENEAATVVLPVIFAEKDRMGGDAAFVEILQKAPVITAQSASVKGKGVPVPRGLATIGGNADGWLYDYPNAIGPVKEIGESSAGVGMLLTAPELDGVVRRLPLIVQVKNETYPTMPLEILRVFAGEPSYQAKINEAGIQAVRVKGSNPINTDANGRVWVNFKYKFESISYIDKDWSKVKGKIAVLALTAEGLSNTVATPVGTAYGHEISMQALQMLVDGNRLERKAEFDLYELAVGIFGGLILITIAAYFGYMYNGAIVSLFLVVPYFVGMYLFNNKGYLVDYTWPTLALFIPWVGAIFMRFVMEFKLKMQIKKQFGTYLSPALVEKLQKNPGLLKLGGDERELSIMFTDVRGFTSISEHYGKNVQGLTMIMNRYMTAMTQAILDNDGTLDKYIGDAQMAFWNAPLDDPHHAKNAVKTAMSMLKRLDSFNEEISKEGVPAFGMGLGINTGAVVVGNMGSTQRFDYTCLGDHVNLASRLEGQSKPYGVRIVIGPETAKHVQDEYQLFELDIIAVKGKKEGVRIFTVLETPLSDEERVHILVSHQMFLQDYRSRQWNNAIYHAKELMKYNKELKKYYEMMIERIEYLKDNDPGENWDGVYRATSK